MTVAVAEAIKPTVEAAGEVVGAGRMQISAARRRLFYIGVARHQFATNKDQNSIEITALGSACPNAISCAHELVNKKVGTITGIKTSYEPVSTENAKPIARLVIMLERNPAWVADEADIAPRQSRRPAPVA